MKKIALINVTINAVNPMMEYFLKNIKDARLLTYLDTEIMEIVNSDGRITDRTMGRMLRLISEACDDGADGILLTCTVFSPFVKKIQPLFSVPIISADGAMLEKAVKMGGRTAILCTFPATVISSKQIYSDAAACERKQNDMEIFLLEDAFRAIRKGNKAEHDRLIAKKILEVEEEFDNIVLAQISMAHVAKQVVCKRPVLTSIETSFNALMESLQ